MAYNLGNAYINVIPKMDGAGRTIEKELAGVGERAGSAKGKGLGGKLFGGLKVAAAGAGVAVGGVLAGSISKGFNRLRDIENAEAKLTGLGHSAETVEGVMKNALASVKGTAFGLGDAAGLAGTLVASGIKPGKDLEKTLKLTADSATIAGRELGDMGLIWGSVAAKGKLQGDDAMQLLASGVPIWQMVGDVMGKTAGEAQELGSKGEVSFEIFQKAMEKGVGGAAQKAGNTTEGAFKNMGAAMGRFGATLLKDVYPLVGPVLNKVTDLFDYLDGAAGPVMETITGKIRDFGKGIKGVWDVLVGGDFTGAENLFGFEEDSAFVGFLFGVRDVALQLYEQALKPLGSWIADNWKPIATVLGGIAAFFVGGALVSAIGAVGAAIAGFVSGISWIGVAIGAAIGAITAFFTQTDTGRAILQGFVSFVTEQLWPIIKSRFEAIRDLAVQVWQGVIQPAFEQFVGFLQSMVFPIIQRLWQEYVQPAFMAIGGLAVWLWENAFKPAMSGIDTFIRNVLGPVIVWLWQNVVSPIFGLIGKFIGWVWETLIFPYLDAMKYYFTVVLPAVFKFLWEVAKQAWSGISAAISAVVDWITGTAVPFIKAAWDLIAGSAKWLWGVFVAVWNGIKGAVAAVVNWFKAWVWPVLEMVIKLIQIGFNGLRNALHTAWMYIRDNIIKPVVLWFQNTAWPTIRTVIEAIKLGFNVMRDALKKAWQFVKDRVISPVVHWFKNTAWPILRGAIDSVKTGFNVMRDAIKAAWRFVKDRVISPVANWFRDKIKPLFDRSTNGVSDAFTSMKDSIKTAWEAVKTAAKAPIKFVVQTVVNDALIGNFNKVAKKLGTSELPSVRLPSGFARGGVLPGKSRMRDGDDQLVPMRRGEGVLVSEGLRTREDRQAFLAANAAGRRGVGFASLMQGGFAGGGILGRAWDSVKGIGRSAKDLAGDALDKVLEGVDFVAEALKDPSSIFKKVYDAVAGSMPGVGDMVSLAKGAGSKLLSGVVEKAKSLIAPTPDAPGGPAKAGGSLGKAQALARQYGLAMTSFRRPGARTAGSGSVSLHAQGRAMDFSNSSGPTPQMMAFFNAMHPFRPTELLYTPAGARNIHRGGRQYANTGATARIHYNHVHVGFRNGGWTGPGSKYQPAGIVHADEHVIRKESRASIERARPGFLDRLNAYGASALKGYASGGRVSPTAKIGSTKVTVILDGLVGTEKQVKSAAGKLADGIAKTFRDRFKGSQKKTVDRLSDSLKALKAQSSQLKKTMTLKSSAAKKTAVNRLSDDLASLRAQAKRLDPKKQAKQLASVRRQIESTQSALTRARRGDYSGAAAATAAKLRDVQKQIASTEAALKQARRGNTSAAATKAADAFFTKYAASATAKLQSLAKQTNSLNAKLKTARASLTDAMKVRDEYAASMSEKLRDTYSLSEDSGNLSVKTLIGDFKLAATKVTTFSGLLTKLRKKGLSNGLIDQIAQLGPDSGAQVAKNILGGTDSQIKQLTSAYNKMNSASDKSASSLAKSMYQAGVDSAAGLVKGLNSQLSKVTKASENLAARVVATVRKKLKIKSPSRVFRQIGVYTGQGMSEGIHKVTPEVQSAMARLATPPEAITGDVSVGADGGARSGNPINVTVQAAHGEDPSRIGRRVAESLNLYSLSAAL